MSKYMLIIVKFQRFFVNKRRLLFSTSTSFCRILPKMYQPIWVINKSQVYPLSKTAKIPTPRRAHIDLRFGGPLNGIIKIMTISLKVYIYTIKYNIGRDMVILDPLKIIDKCGKTRCFILYTEVIGVIFDLKKDQAVLLQCLPASMYLIA